MIPLSHQQIPVYDAEADTHCTYTNSQAFKASPYFKLKLSETAKVSGSASEARQEPAAGNSGVGASIGIRFPKLPRPEVNAYRLAALDELLPVPSRKAVAFTRFTFLELEAMKAVFHREALVNALRGALAEFQGRCERVKGNACAVEELVVELVEVLEEHKEKIRKASLQVVERVQLWRRGVRSGAGWEERPPQLTWKGSNYLLRMAIDMNFLAHVRLEGTGIGMQGLLRVPPIRNPFLLPLSLDALMENGSDCCFRDVMALPGTGRKHSHEMCQRLVSAAQQLLEEEKAFGRLAVEDDPSVVQVPAGQPAVYTEEKLKLFDRMISRWPGEAKDGGQRVTSRDDSSIGRRRRVFKSPVDISEHAGLIYMQDRTLPKLSKKAGKVSVSGTHLKDSSGIKISAKMLVQLRHSPPTPQAYSVLKALHGLLVLLPQGLPPPEKVSWRSLVTLLFDDIDGFFKKLASFTVKQDIPTSLIDYLKPIFTSPVFHPDVIRPVNKPAALLCSWCIVKAGPSVLTLNTAKDVAKSLHVQLDSLRSEISAMKQEVAECKVKSKEDTQTAQIVCSTAGFTIERQGDEDMVVHIDSTGESILVTAPLVSKLLGHPLSAVPSCDRAKELKALVKNVSKRDEGLASVVSHTLYRGVHRKHGQTIYATVKRATLLTRCFAVHMSNLGSEQKEVSFVTDDQLNHWFIARRQQSLLKGLVDWKHFPRLFRCFLRHCISINDEKAPSISAVIPCGKVTVDGYSAEGSLVVTADGNYEVRIRWKSRRMQLQLKAAALTRNTAAFPPMHWQELFNCFHFDEKRKNILIKPELSPFTLQPLQAADLILHGRLPAHLDNLVLSKLKRKRRRKRKARKRPTSPACASAGEDKHEAAEKEKALEEETREKEVFLEQLQELPFDVTATPGSTTCYADAEALDVLCKGNKLSIGEHKYNIRKVEEDEAGQAMIHLETPFIAQGSPERTERRVKATKLLKIPTSIRKLEGSVSVAKDSLYLTCTKDLRYDVRRGHHLRLDGVHVVKLSNNKEDTFEEFCLTLADPFVEEDLHKVKVEHVLPKSPAKTRFSVMPKSAGRRDKRRETNVQGLWLKRKEELASDQVETVFGYRVKWGDVRAQLGSGPCSKHVKDYIRAVSKDTALHAMFQMLCQDWLPSASTLDGNKFAKFVKELPKLLNDKFTPTHVDLVFTKIKNQGERRIDFDGFISQALPNMAQERFPWLDPEEAMEELLSKYIYVWEGFKGVVRWEALKLAVHDEGMQQCGALKIESVFRGFQARKEFRRHLQAVKSIQRAFFAFRQRSMYKQALLALREARNLKARRTLAKRQAIKHAKLFAQAKVISGVVNIITIFKHTKGAVRVTVYNPKTSESFVFIVLPDELQAFAEAKFGLEDLLGEALYEKRVLLCIVERLAYRKRQGKLAVVIGRSTITEKGEVLLVQGRYLQTNTKQRLLHIIKILEYRGNYCFHAYEPHSQQTKTVELKVDQLYRWFDYDKSKAEPELFKTANRPQLLQWFLDHLYICTTCALQTHRAKHRAGESVLMLEFEVIEQRENLMAARIQSLFRNKQARVRVREMLFTVYKKQKHFESGKWFYVNRINGSVSWTKPLLLGTRDLPDPPNAWEQTTDEQGNVYYFNPFNGKTSWLSEDDAAKVVQRMYRSKEGAVFKIKDMSQLVTALKFQVKAEVEYERDPTKLSAIVNYAMLIFTRDHDLVGTKPLLIKALEAAPNNPLILRIVGLYELAACEYPRPQKFEEALTRIEFANSIDKEFLKFMTAFNAFFYWSIVANPNSAKGFLNYALVQQCVFKDYDKAQKFYRKALDLDPNDLNIVQNYNDFLENRLPAGRFAGGGPGLQARKRAVVVNYFGEWQECKDPEMNDPRFSTFWFNEIKQLTQWAEPDWELVWLERRNRSTLLQERLSWAQFQDPYKSTVFYYNYSLKQYTYDTPDEFL